MGPEESDGFIVDHHAFAEEPDSGVGNLGVAMESKDAIFMEVLEGEGERGTWICWVGVADGEEAEEEEGEVGGDEGGRHCWVTAESRVRVRARVG